MLLVMAHTSFTSDFINLSFLSIFFFFFFFLVSLADDLSILLIFLKNQLLVSLIFSIVFLFYNSFISALTFIISFLLFTWVQFVIFLDF